MTVTDPALRRPRAKLRKPRVLRGEVHALAGALVRDRRSALCQMSHDELLAIYAHRIARRTRLADTALIDLIIWTEGRRR